MTKDLTVRGGRGQAGEENGRRGWQGVVGTEKLGALTAAPAFPLPVSGRVANNSEEPMGTVTKTLHLSIPDLHFFFFEKKKKKKKKKKENPKTEKQQQKTQPKPKRT
jgi:hypothetical protein